VDNETIYDPATKADVLGAYWGKVFAKKDVDEAKAEEFTNKFQKF
jgi:AICAR transformylase/IMP cyclohydrolase PurH